MVSRTLCPVALCLLAALPAVAEMSVLAEIGGLEAGDLEVRGFALEREQEVRVEGLGLGDRVRERESFELADAWILNASSREIVWSLRDARPSGRRRDLVQIDEALRLAPGAYEAYYATVPKYRSGDWGGGWWESAGRSVARAFGWGDGDYERAVGGLELVVRGDGRALDSEEVEGARDRLRAQAAVTLPAQDDGFSQFHGFRLARPMEVLIYAVGELTEDSGRDYGWILDAESRERVWTFTWEASDHAGGAKKNRVVYDEVSLPAGSYAAYFVTDDSHSPQRWNALPPRDPAFWGLTVWPKDPQQLLGVQAFEYRHLPDDDRVIVALAPMRDDEQRSESFRLERAMEVRIYAVGEGREHGMDDRGWILDARTRRKVWEMEFERTEHAGGAAKNRVADELVRLEPGSYVVTFVTDGSHAYRDWNASPPPDPERWGITVFGGKDFDRSAVAAYDEGTDPGVLARIARVRSERRERLGFTLDRDAEVSVYALGEGTHGEMYDYAWLEGAGGRVVWEMTYRLTEDAGGASKNRRFQGTLQLAAGDYVLRYRTDDSHAFDDWNASPPDDPEAWGVQVSLIE